MVTRTSFVLVALLGLGAVAGAAAQQRPIAGRVTNSVTNEPLIGASVSVLGTPITAVTGDDGTFTLSAPEGGATLAVRLIGFKRRSVVVPADQTTVAVSLEPDVFNLEAIVVTGQATGIERRNLPNAVATLTGGEVARVTAPSVEHAIQGKVAGVDVQSNSGAPGGGLQVRLRGVTSFLASAEPLYVVDGVVVSNVAIPSNQNAVTNAAGGSNPSLNQDGQVNRIVDLNPNDIQNIEVLKGASAAAIYGSKAASGVIIITTKRGRVGAPRFDLTQRFGVSELSNTLGSRSYETLAEATSAWGSTAADFYVQGRVFDQERLLAGRKPLSTETAVSVSGGTENTRYYASGLWKNDQGIIENTGFDKQAVRLNLDQQLGSRVNVTLNTNVIHTLARRGLTNNDNLSTSFYMALPFTPSFVDLRRQADSFPDNPYVASNPLETAALMTNDEDVWRYIAAGQVTVDAVRTERHNLQFLANGGVDYFAQRNFLLFPRELQFEDDDGEPGTSLLSNSDNVNVNLNANAIHTYNPPGAGLTARTAFGFQYSERDLEIARVVSRNLIGGQSNVDLGTNVQVRQRRERVEDFGLFLQEEVLALDERLLLTAGFRADQTSANGDPEKLFFYPKAAASYRFTQLSDFVDELKLRVAYGQSGNQPLFGQKFTPLEGFNNIGGLPGPIVEGTVGAPDVKPERQSEIEAGFDAALWRGRATLEFTAYRKLVTDLLLQRTLAPSSGFLTQILNGGKLRTHGLEIGLGIVPVQSSDVRWLFRTNFALSRSKILELPVPTFRSFGFGTALGTFQIENGASPTQIVGNDSLPDGTRFVGKIGDANPDFKMGFTSDLSYRGFSLYAVADWQQGGDVINLTKFLYDLGSNTVDYDQAIPGSTQTVGERRLAVFPKQTGVFIEDATFVKLREVTLSYDLPQSVVGGLWGGARYVRLSVSGRNLITITDYTGLDPEVSNFGNQNIARNIDVAPFPPSRSFWFSIELGF